MHTYTINMIDSDDPIAWHSLPHVVSARPGAQDSGYCRWTAVTTDCRALERALDADPDVLEYALLSPTLVDVAASVGTPSMCCGPEADDAYDYDITLSMQGSDGQDYGVEAEVTLVGGARWGSVENWLSSRGIDALAGMADADRDDAYDRIVAACRDAGVWRDLVVSGY